MVLKVKEPIESEFPLLHEGLILFTYLHLAASDVLTKALIESKVTAIAYETVEAPDGSLPLLAPMSEVAGHMAPQVGASFLEREHGGRGVLLGGVSEMRTAGVIVIGAGMAGMNAAWIAQGMEAEVVVLDKNINKLRDIDRIHPGKDPDACLQPPVGRGVRGIGRVHDRGGSRSGGAPCQGSDGGHDREHAAKGAVVVNISVDTGRIFRDDAHDNALGSHVPGSRRRALLRRKHARSRSTHLHLRSYEHDHASRRRSGGQRSRGQGPRKDPGFARGINVYKGSLVYQPVAEAHGLEWTELRVGNGLASTNASRCCRDIEKERALKVRAQNSANG